MDYLSQGEREKLDVLKVNDAAVTEVLSHLDRMLASRTFQRVGETTRAFLTFVISKKLLGQADEIKETMIAIRVWPEDRDFDPLVTSKIRTAARAIRKKIAEYYRSEGRCDSIEIRLPDWGYVPDIGDRRLSVDVALFENLNPSGDQSHLCSASCDEIVYRLSHAGAIEAKRVTALTSGAGGSHFGLRGCLGCRGDEVRLNVSLQDLRAALIVWDAAFEGERGELLRLSQKVADTVLSVLRPKVETVNVATSRRRSAMRKPVRSINPLDERTLPNADIA
jgi:TolB-like protein